MGKLFEKIYEKIKFIAFLVFGLGTIGSVMYAFILFDDWEKGAGAAFLILGPVASYISSVFIYGFGELIERITTSEINMTSKDGFTSKEKSVKEESNKNENTTSDDISKTISAITTNENSQDI